MVLTEVSLYVWRDSRKDLDEIIDTIHMTIS